MDNSARFIFATQVTIAAIGLVSLSYTMEACGLLLNGNMVDDPHLIAPSALLLVVNSVILVVGTRAIVEFYEMVKLRATRTLPEAASSKQFGLRPFRQYLYYRVESEDFNGNYCYMNRYYSIVAAPQIYELAWTLALLLIFYTCRYAHTQLSALSTSFREKNGPNFAYLVDGYSDTLELVAILGALYGLLGCVMVLSTLVVHFRQRNEYNQILELNRKRYKQRMPGLDQPSAVYQSPIRREYSFAKNSAANISPSPPPYEPDESLAWNDIWSSKAHVVCT